MTDLPRYRTRAYDRLRSIGIGDVTAHELAAMLRDLADAEALHALIEALTAAGGLGLLPLLARRRLTPERVQSLLRAAGAVDGRRLSVPALDALREALINPYPRRAEPSPYLTRSTRHA